MINPKNIFDALTNNNLTFFTGVGDSTFKGLISYFYENAENHVPTTNEGEAIGLAIGHHLATGDLPVVYLQNSGLGNCVNPITSLAHEDVYKVPMLLLVGWRGEPGVKDEPQHKKMGRMTKELLELMDVEYEILDEDYANQIKRLKEKAIKNNSIHALVIRKGSVDDYKLKKPEETGLLREEAVELVSRAFPSAVFVGTTGKTSRELFEIRTKYGEPHNDFYTVGGMGHASSIALGVARNTDKKVVLLNGDGAFLMHMGSFATKAKHLPNNLVHILIDNNAHESTGGQQTSSDTINFDELAKACGLDNIHVCETNKELEEALSRANKSAESVFIVVKSKTGSRKDLGRPTKTPLENKEGFMSNFT